MAPLDKRPARIRALVVDDESLARRNLTVLLRRDPDIGSVAECGSGLEAIERDPKIEARPGVSRRANARMRGLRRARIAGQRCAADHHLCDGLREYALRAFEAGALDYLLKPFDDARFARALSRAKDKLAHYAARSRTDGATGGQGSGPGAVPECRGHRLDRGRGLLRLLACGDNTHIMRRTLLELERDLGEEKFIRIHRSIIVNLDRIRGLELQSGGEYEVVLKSKVRLRLSRRFRKRLQDRMGAMSGGDG